MASDITLNEIIDMLWVHPENAEWKPKTNVIPRAEFRRWMASDEIEILGFTYVLLGDHRFRLNPELSLDEYLEFVRGYYKRCFIENPDGEWSDSRYSAGWDLVNVLAFQWTSPDVPSRSWKIGSDGWLIFTNKDPMTFANVLSPRPSNICSSRECSVGSLPIGQRIRS